MHKTSLIYHYLITNILYRFKSIKMGGKVIICSPILITAKYLNFGSRVFIRNSARIEGIASYLSEKFNPIIEFSDGVSIEQNLHLTCAEKIYIGENTSISANVTITDINHPYENIDISPEMQKIEVRPVYIGADCKIYNNVVILPGTILGKHCVVGANTVVTGRSYPDYSIIVGIPSKIIKRYSFEKKAWFKTDISGNFT